MNRYKVAIDGYKPQILRANYAEEALHKWCGLPVYGRNVRIECPDVTWLTIDADTYGIKWALGWVKNGKGGKRRHFSVDIVE